MFLLDTHVLLWWLANIELAPEIKELIANPRTTVMVSSATTWEIAIKKNIGKLESPDDLEDQININNFLALPIQINHSMYAGQLISHHGDPFDRMLIAQAKIEGLTLITRDSRFESYDVSLLMT